MTGSVFGARGYAILAFNGLLPKGMAVPEGRVEIAQEFIPGYLVRLLSTSPGGTAELSLGRALVRSVVPTGLVGWPATRTQQ